MTERRAGQGAVAAPRGDLSSQLCAEVLRTLDRIYAAEGSDEPDLGLNVAYMTARRSIQRLGSAKPWVVPAPNAGRIREAIVSIAAQRDPRALDTELLSFPTWVIRLLDRRRIDRGTTLSSRAHRRIGDLVRPQSPAARLMWVPTRAQLPPVRTPG